MKRLFTAIIAISIAILLCATLQAGAGTAKAPEVVTLDSISDAYEPVFFTHDRHVKIAGDCGSCHHEHGNTKSLPCKDCHSIPPESFKNSVTKNFMACRSCHGGANPDTPAMPGLKIALHRTCFQCHKGMGNIGADPKGCTEICHAKKEQKIGKK